MIEGGTPSIGSDPIADPIAEGQHDQHPNGQPPPRQPWYILQDLVERTGHYTRALHHFQTRPSSWDVAAESERALANAMRRVLILIDELDSACQGRAGERLGLANFRRIVRLGSLIRSQADRWGWQAYLDPDSGGWFVDRRLRAHREHNYIPFLQACLTWRSDLGAEDHEAADRYADEARSLQIETLDLNADEARELTWRLHRVWCNGSALNDELPSVSPDELRQCVDALGQLRSWVGSLVSPDEINEIVRRGEQIRQEAAAALEAAERTRQPSQQTPTPREVGVDAEGEAVSRERRRTPAPETDRRVADYLANNPRASIDAVVRDTGLPKSSISKSAAWQAEQTRRRTPAEARSVRTRDLNDRMLAVLPNACTDPTELFEEFEHLEPAYLRTLSPSDQRRYRNQNVEDKVGDLMIFKSENGDRVQ